MTRIPSVDWNFQMQGARAADADADDRPLIDMVGDIFPDIEWMSGRPREEEQRNVSATE
jgi:hypothetical protein